MIKKGLLALSIMALVACGGEPSDTTTDTEVAETKSATEVAQTEEQVEQDKTFGITPDEFGKQFSDVASEAGLGNHDISNFNIKEGEVNDVFTEILSDAIALNGVVDKNGELKSLTYIMTGAEDAQTEVMNLAMMAGMTARALSPNLPKEETAGAVISLITESAEKFASEDEVKESKVVDNVEYTVMINKVTGLWVIFEPAE